MRARSYIKIENVGDKHVKFSIVAEGAFGVLLLLDVRLLVIVYYLGCIKEDGE